MQYRDVRGYSHYSYIQSKLYYIKMWRISCLSKLSGSPSLFFFLGGQLVGFRPVQAVCHIYDHYILRES